MDLQLRDKLAIVTGSSKGIGHAIAASLAREGARVVVTGRTEDAGRAVEEEIRAAGGEGVFVPTDLAREDDVVQMVATAMERYGSLTTLVNNAAPTELMGPGRLDRRVTELENDAWDSIMLVALKAVVWSCKYAIPAMTASAKSGSAFFGFSRADRCRNWLRSASRLASSIRRCSRSR